MSVLEQRVFSSSSLFTPFHTKGRGSPNGLVGTVSVDALTTGDATGGTVTINLRMGRQEFGFPILWVPTIINTKDNLAAAEPVFFAYTSAGNRRLRGPLEEVVTALRASSVNTAIMTNVSVPIEGVGAVDQVFTVVWDTNTDTLAYHLHMFGAVYDLQVIARNGGIDPIVAGLR